MCACDCTRMCTCTRLRLCLNGASSLRHALRSILAFHWTMHALSLLRTLTLHRRRMIACSKNRKVKVWCKTVSICCMEIDGKNP